MSTVRWICVFAVTMCAPASACMCISTPICAQISVLANSHAVFVGQVLDVRPARETILGERERLPLTQLRQLLLERWRGSLTAEEEQYIRTATNRDGLESRFGIMQVVRFAVTEILTGPEIREVYTDVSSCGYHFEPGLTYLVDASRTGTRYQTGACSRTGKVDSDEAVEDLKALRAWRDGNPLAPRIYGRFRPEDLRPDTRVRLVDDQGREESIASPDAGGRFSFDGQRNGHHWLEIEDARAKGRRRVDLFSCFEATPLYSEGWSILGAPVVIDSAHTPMLPEPPPIKK